MRAMQIAEKGGDFELVEREVPSPGRGEVAGASRAGAVTNRLPEHGHPRHHLRRRLRRLPGGEVECPRPDPRRPRRGITTYNALRNSGARGGDLVAVLGVGGLGHLGIQFAAKLSYRTVAIARGTVKEGLARPTTR